MISGLRMSVFLGDSTTGGMPSRNQIVKSSCRSPRRNVCEEILPGLLNAREPVRIIGSHEPVRVISLRHCRAEGLE